MPKFVIDSKDAVRPNLVSLEAYGNVVSIIVNDYVIAQITEDGQLKIVGGVGFSSGLHLVKGRVVVTD